MTKPQFVIDERDLTAPATVRYWCARRIATGENAPDDAQIIDALAWADAVTAEHRRGVNLDVSLKPDGGQE